jgi:sigma-B regulation protein RsbU (phosphoserine phosphatase)
VRGALQVEGTRVQQIRKLTEVSRALTYAATLDEVLQLTVARAADLLDTQKALLMVADDEGLLSLRSSVGVDTRRVGGFHEPLSEGLVGRLAGLLDMPPECFLGVPLVVGGAIRGILVVIRREPSNGAEQDEWLLSALADQAAAAFEKTRLDEIGEFREQLIGVIGHDLRTPLSTILLGTDILLHQEGLAEKETEVARRIARSAQLAIRLIEQLLDLTRSRLGGGIPIDPARVDLHDICRLVLDETELAHPDRPLCVETTGDLIGVWDRDRLYQLLANLVGNAVQHGEPRTPIQMRVHGGDTEVLIEVTNRGEPIPPDAMPYIFDAFRKGRTALARTQGLGLGLFIAQEIARSHGGSIAVSSSEIDGTTFRVRLPRAAAVAVTV